MTEQSGSSLLDKVKSEYYKTHNIENSRKLALHCINKYITDEDFSKINDFEELKIFTKLFKKIKFLKRRNSNSYSDKTQWDIKYLKRVRDILENYFSNDNLSLLIKVMKHLDSKGNASKSKTDTLNAKTTLLEDPLLKKTIIKKNILLIRTIILNHIDIDVNRKNYLSEKIIREIEPNLLQNGLVLFEEENNEFKFPSQDDWNKQLWQSLKVEMRYNFSMGKFNQIIEVMKFLRKKGDEFFQIKTTNFTK